MFKFSTKSLALLIAVLIISLGVVFMVQAWTEPSSNPPGGNVAAPINVSGTAQTKAGHLTVGGLTSNGDINLSGNAMRGMANVYGYTDFHDIVEFGDSKLKNVEAYNDFNLRDHDLDDVNDIRVNNIYDGDGGGRIEVYDTVDMNNRHLYNVNRLYTDYLYKWGGGNIHMRDHIDFDNRDIYDANRINADCFYDIQEGSCITGGIATDKYLPDDPADSNVDMNGNGITFTGSFGGGDNYIDSNTVSFTSFDDGSGGEIDFWSGLNMNGNRLRGLRNVYGDGGSDILFRDRPQSRDGLYIRNGVAYFNGEIRTDVIQDRGGGNTIRFDSHLNANGHNLSSAEVISFTNNEWGSHSADGGVYWDKSAGLYVRSSNADYSNSNGRLIWSGANVHAGSNINISYDGEDEPTISASGGGGNQNLTQVLDTGNDANNRDIWDVNQLATDYLYKAGGGNIHMRDHIDFDNRDIYDANQIYADAFLYASDKKLKKDISSLGDNLEKVLNLEGVSFKWKDNGKESIGLIAQDVEQVFPQVVTTNEKGLKSIDYGKLVAPLIESIKAQQNQIEELKEENEQQQQQIDQLQQEIEQIKEEIE